MAELGQSITTTRQGKSVGSFVWDATPLSGMQKMIQRF